MYTTPTQIYQFKSYFYWRTNNTVFITIKIPLTPFKHNLRLMKSYVFPLPIPEQNCSTILTKVPKYVAWNDNDKQYLTFEDRPSLDEHGIMHLDSSVQVPYIKSSPSCTTALMSDDVRSINYQCTAVLSRESCKPTLLAVGSSTILLTCTTRYALQCPNGTAHRDLNTTAVSLIFVPCGCTLLSKDSIFWARRINCTGSQFVTESKPLGHVLNMHLLASFFDDEKLKPYVNQTLSTDARHVVVPNLTQYLTTYDDSIATVKRDNLLLEKVAEATKRRAVIFGNLADKIKHETESTSGIFHKPQNADDWILLVTPCLCAILVPSTLYLWRRIVMLNTMVQLLNRPVNAMPSPLHNISPISLIDNADSMDTNVGYYSVIQTLTSYLGELDIMLVLLFLSTSTYIVIRLYKLHPSPYTFSLTLQFGNENHTHNTHFITLPHEARYYNITAATSGPTNMTLSGYLLPTLVVEWPALTFTHKLTFMKYNAPTFIRVWPWSRFAISRILQGTRRQVLLIGKNNSRQLYEIMLVKVIRATSQNAE